MQSRYGSSAESLRASFWFLPALMTVTTVFLAWLTLQVDARVDWLWSGVLYNGGSVGARVVLGSIAASMVTVAATVFSVTIVAMTLASSQFGPRVLVNFVRDRGNQASIGFFAAVFLYALLVMRYVKPREVPNISISIAVFLALAAVVVLIYFIHHIATTIQVMNLAQRISEDLHAGIDDIFPDTEDLGDAAPAGDVPELEGHGHAVRAESSGYLQTVDLSRLIRIASENDLLVQLDLRPGRFLVDRTPVAHVWAGDGSPVDPGDAVLHRLATTVVTGPRRIRHQDVEFPLRQLVEVAVRTLSPAINDPFTASACVNHIGAALCQAASREFPPRVYADAQGRTRLVVDDPVTFDRFVGESFDQIRQAANAHVIVYLHILEALTRVVDCTHDERRWAVLRRQGDLVLERAAQVVPQQADLDVVRERHEALLAQIEHERVDR